MKEGNVIVCKIPKTQNRSIPMVQKQLRCENDLCDLMIFIFKEDFVHR